MRKILLFLFSILLGLPLAAQEKRHRFEVAYEMSDYAYKEPRGSPIQLTGAKFGVSGAYWRRSILSPYVNEQDPSFAVLGLRYMTGNVEYDGSLNDTAHTPFQASGLTDYYFEAALKTGWNLKLTAAWEFSPYLGIGWRYLRNHLEQAGSEGYLRISNYVYMPLGTYVKYQPCDGFSLTANGEFDWLLSGQQYSDISGTGGITNTQDQGYGLRASVRGTWHGGAVSLFIEPFWRYWHIQNSDVVFYAPFKGIYEPFNITREWGARIGFLF